MHGSLKHIETWLLVGFKQADNCKANVYRPQHYHYDVSITAVRPQHGNMNAGQLRAGA